VNRLSAGTLIFLLGSPLTAGCQSAGSRLPPTAALLTESTQACRAQIDDAVRELLGKAAVLAVDAFLQNDAVVLSTVGQSASGRMMPPTEVLRLQLAPPGCQLRLEGRERTVALPHCRCRAIAGN